MPQVLSPEQTRRLVQKFSKTGPDLERQYRHANDPGYWTSLNPNLTVGSGEQIDWDSIDPLSDKAIEDAVSNYRTHGFLSLAGVLSLPRISIMRQAVENLRNADWLSVFSFMYDDFWLIGRATQLKKLLTNLLGPDYRLLPRIWTHYVYPAMGQSGWGPHLDGDKKSVHTVSVWIPLGIATLTNGCMHLVKRTDQTNDVCLRYHDTEIFTRPEVEALLKNTRALPAEPGHVLCWDEKILHWGGRFETGSEPRVSLALEFTTADMPLTEKDPLLIDPMASLPSIDVRLQAIGRAISTYRQFEPLIERFAPLAKMLCQVSV